MEKLTIKITPPALKTPEGSAKLPVAAREFEDSAAALANAAILFFDTWDDQILHAMDRYEIAENVAEIRSLIVTRRKKQEAFLTAFAG